jgi:hypothetical protein
MHFYKTSYISLQSLGKVVTLIGVLLISLNTYQTEAQNISVNAKLDSTLIFIGGQIDLTLEVSQPSDVHIQFPAYTDTVVKAVEVVDASPIDTLKLENNRLVLTQQYRITSFDSGLHYLPPIRFELAQDDYKRHFETEGMALMVMNPFQDVDPEKGLQDIKAPVDAPFSLAELLPYLPWVALYAVIIIAIILGVYYYYNRKLPIGIVKREKVKEPPHVVALRHLEKIKADKLWQRDQVKKYYSEMTDTLRHYIEERYQLPAMESTTEEILRAIQQVDLPDAHTYDKLKDVLELADFVKFAKFKPLPDENDLSMINAVFFVNQTKYEELKTLEEEKEQMLRKDHSESDTPKSLNTENKEIDE